MMDALNRAREYLAGMRLDGFRYDHPITILAALVAEIDAAPVVDVYSAELQRTLMAMEGKRVRLLALDSGDSHG